MKTLSPHVFARRRQQLAEYMGSNAVAVIATRAEMYRNRDADYKYRADSSFYYLTGFPEPEAVAVLETDAQGQLRYSLFCRPRHREMEIWTGFRAGIDGAVQQYQADQAFAIEELDRKIPALIADKTRLYVNLGQDDAFDLRLSGWIKQVNQQQRQGGKAPAQLIQLNTLIDEMRLIKSAEEIELMQITADISAEAHLRAMQNVYPGMMEYALEAELNYVFGQHGCVPSYNSIVGGGANACILHYVENNQPLKDGDLVLIDAACEYQYYAADITRTFPINGRFSGEQRALYEIVLQAQLAAIAATCAGKHYRHPHETVCRILTEGLLDLGILHGELNELVETEAYKPFYMHGTGHWLGMDVHDVGDYKVNGQWREYQDGMVVTVEPGLYIQPDLTQVDERWRGIGIRIEDNVLVQGQQPQVLTSGVIKHLDDIEHFMREARHS